MPIKIAGRPKFLALLALSNLLGGCFMVGPDFEKPQIELPEKWLREEGADLKRGDYREWWKLFGDPVLDALVETAYRQNLDLQKAAVRILEARAQLGIARGSLFPQKQQLGLELVYNRLSERSPNFEVTDDPTFGSFQLGFDALWELDLWGRFRRGIESANANLAVSLLDYDDLLVSLTAEVAAGYVQIRTFEQRLKLAGENVEIQRHTLRIAEVLLQNGIGNELDMQQAKALLHSTKALIASLEVGLKQTKNALSTLLGIVPSDLADLLVEEGPVPGAVADVVVGIPADMLRRRPDVRREEWKAAAQSALIGVAKADLLPRFSLRGQIGFNASSTGSVDTFDLFSGESVAAAVGPTVTWPILHYGRLKNQVRLQDARFQQLLIGYRNAVLRALREVEDAMIAFLKGRREVADLEESVSASRRAVDLSLALYREGLEDYTPVLNSQQFLTQQQDKLIDAQGGVARHIISLYKALGGGWEIRDGKPLVPKAIAKKMAERTDWEDLLEESGAVPR